MIASTVGMAIHKGLVDGAPVYVEGGPGGPGLMRWSRGDGSGTAVALNHRVPISRLRRVSRTAP